MSLLNDDLSLWEIAFRWEDRDPDRFWWRIPLPVRDRFRTLIDAIHQDHLDCYTLSPEKWRPDRDDAATPEFFMRHWLEQIEDCTEGRRYDRKLLKWARIRRWDLQQWCERRGIPLPAFWFPPGWKLEYEWPEDEGDEDAAQVPAAAPEEDRLSADKRRRIRMACQQVALFLWQNEAEPRSTVKEMANRREVQELAGGSEYEIETVRDWLGEVDPRNPYKKRGRKRKNNSAPGDAGTPASG